MSPLLLAVHSVRWFCSPFMRRWWRIQENREQPGLYQVRRTVLLLL